VTPFVYRANHYRRVLDFDYDLRNVEAKVKELYDGKNVPINELVNDVISLGQFDNPLHKKSYDKMLLDGYIRFDIGKGHGILIFFVSDAFGYNEVVHIRNIIAS
jgi:hypothetical protein